MKVQFTSYSVNCKLVQISFPLQQYPAALWSGVLILVQKTAKLKVSGINYCKSTWNGRCKITLLTSNSSIFLSNYSNCYSNFTERCIYFNTRSILWDLPKPTTFCNWLVCNLPFSPIADLQTISSLPTADDGACSEINRKTCNAVTVI
jgi:hypothetical protein